MKQLLAVPVAAFLLAAAPAAPKVADLAWLGGVWVAEEKGSWTEERWAPPRGGAMLGTSLSGRGNRAGHYEFMRIEADGEGRVSFWASPRGAVPSGFPLVSAAANEVVFENPAHDYPTRIVYRREGDKLIATISGAGGKNQQTWRFRRAR